MTEVSTPTALVTGGAQRIGAAIVRQLSDAGYQVAIGYRHSEAAATELADRVGRDAFAVQLDVTSSEDRMAAVKTLEQRFDGRLSLLVNNASTFYRTPLDDLSRDDWDDLMGSNARGPLFLSQALVPPLRAAHGSIVNLVDIHTRNPRPNYSIYTMAKAALVAATRSLAVDLAPAVRVNAVAPGAIIWPETDVTEAEKQRTLSRIPLQRTGKTTDIADAVLYLARASYVTGQILAVDGGRSLQV